MWSSSGCRSVSQTSVPPEISRVFEKLGENFKNFPHKVCREKIFNFLVCREPKKFEKHWATD
jgi:hypothetical protein